MPKDTLSLIIPVFNESGNIIQLHREIKEVVLELIKNKTISDYEIIFVDDGSNDNSQQILSSLKTIEKNKLKIIKFRRNFGQTPALKAGFKFSKGSLIATMDGDLQNDPRDIPRLIEKMKEGYDVVSGWRMKRKDTFAKKIASRMMNNLRRMLIGDNLNDYGCSLKLYKRECVKDIELFGELHRYITAYLSIKGYRIGEIKVNHRPRKAGITKYKFNRGLNGILDLLYLKFWSTYASRPLHFFGRLGFYQWVLAFIIIIEQIVKAILINELTFGPLLALALMLGITGLLFIIFGFLSEIMTRSYFKDKEIYSIKEVK